MEKVLQRIDQARGIGEEPDEVPGQEVSGADRVEILQRGLLENAYLLAPFVTSTLLVRHVRAVKGALKRSAYADVVRAIIECERFIGVLLEDGYQGDRFITYLKTLRGLEGRLGADLDASRAAADGEDYSHKAERSMMKQRIRAGELDSRTDELITLILDSFDQSLISELAGTGWDTVITLMNGVKIIFEKP